jgi:hypothetical protein
MNSQQRKFLIDKMSEKAKEKIKSLEASVPEALSLNVYMLHQVMSNDFEIKPTEELKKIVLEKALKAGQNKQHREDWLGNSWGVANKGNVAFDLKEFFVIPEKYLKMQEEREAIRKKVQEEINAIRLQVETLEVRIMVASDKRLQQLVNEVDDMGDIGLIDTRIKLLD